jgi:hypothetical protein
MPHFIVDLEVIRCLEVSLRKKLKPEEILLVSYIKSFPKGYYGSKEKLAVILRISVSKVYEILKFFKEKNIFIQEKKKIFFDFKIPQYGDDPPQRGDNPPQYGVNTPQYGDNNNIYNNNYNNIYN